MTVMGAMAEPGARAPVEWMGRAPVEWIGRAPAERIGAIAAIGAEVIWAVRSRLDQMAGELEALSQDIAALRAEIALASSAPAALAGAAPTRGRSR